MGNRIELPSGGWVEFVDLTTIRGAHRKRVMSKVDPNANDMLRGYAVMEGMVNECVERYSVSYAPFDNAIRVNLVSEDWDELMITDQNAITNALEPVRAIFFPESASIDNTKPGSPTPPAGE